MTALASRILPPAAALVAVLLSMTSAGAQKAPPPSPLPVEAPPAPAETPKAQPANPGLIHELGKLLGKPADLFPSLKLSPDTAAPATSPMLPSDVATPTPPVTPPPAPPPVVATPAPAPAVPAPAPDAPAPSTNARIPQMVTGRSSCPFAANGAPDCKAGADLLCKSKGFASGSSLDMDSSHNCSKEALLAGARTLKDICRTETFVTRAMCQ